LSDATVPMIISYSPGQGANGVSATSNIVLTFNVNVKAANGAYQISLIPTSGTYATKTFALSDSQVIIVVMKIKYSIIVFCDGGSIESCVA